MCNFCRHSHCSSGCPNSDEPAELYRCEVCEEPIYEGDEYIDYGGTMICADCSTLSVRDCLSHFNYSMKIAEIERD